MTNKEFKALYYSLALPRIEYQKITVHKGTRDEIELEAKLLLPLELDPNHITQYPLLLYT